MKNKNKLKKISPDQQSYSLTDLTQISFPSWSTIVAPLALIVVGALSYLWSLRYAFQFDDLANIIKFYNIRHNTFSQIFFINTRWISYWINTIHYSLGKFNPFSYRLFNVILHCSSSIILFFFFYTALKHSNNKKIATGSFIIAFIASLFFLLHPVQTQTVSYVIQGQLEGLAGFFIFMSSLAFLLSVYASTPLKRYASLIMLFVALFLGCGSKEIFIVTPLLLLLVDWFFIAQGSFNSLKQRLSIHAACWMVVFGIYSYFLKPTFFMTLFGLKMEARNNIGNILTANPGEIIKPLHYCISQFKVILHYIAIFIWPSMMSVEYDWKLVTSFFARDCIIPFSILASFISFLLWLFWRNTINMVVFCWVWFFISIAPRCSIIPSSELLSDYKTYIGSAGLSLLFALGVWYLIVWLQERKYTLVSRQLAWCAPVIIAAPLIVMTIMRNTVWRSGTEFWANIIKNAPGKARAYNNYGVALSEAGDIKGSIPYYQKAISMDPYYPDPINNIAVAFSTLGEIDRAIATLQQSIRIQPNYPEAYNNLASFLITKKEYDQADQALNKALTLRPFYGKAWINKCKMYLDLGKNDLALEAARNCCTKGDMDNETGFNLYSAVSFRVQKFDEAIIANLKLMEINPTNEVIFNLANAYLLNNTIDKAQHWYHHLLATTAAQDARVWYNLGESYWKQDNIQEALNCFNKVQELKFALPNVPIRIAQCYEKLGNIKEASTLFEQVINTPTIPDQLKTVAHVSLAQLKSKAMHS